MLCSVSRNYCIISGGRTAASHSRCRTAAPFSGRIIVFDFQVHDGADPGESVGKDPEQSAIAEARVRGCVDCAQKRLDFAVDKCRVPFLG
jgi:hypothetical protein